MFRGRLERWRTLGNGLLKGGGAPIALDFGASALKVLQVQPGHPATLVAAAALATPDELVGDPAKRLAFQLESLPKLLRTAGFRGKRAVCGIPASQTFAKHLQIQPAEEVPMGELVRAAVAGQFHCAPESLLCRHVDVGPAVSGGGKREVIALATARQTVEKIMQGMRHARLEPVGMHAECHALLRGFEHLTGAAAGAGAGAAPGPAGARGGAGVAGGETGSVTLFLDLGASGTRVLIAHGPALVFCKSIGIGGQYLDQVAAQQLRCEAGEARRVRQGLTTLVKPPKAAPAASTPAATTNAAAAGSTTGADHMPGLDAAVRQARETPRGRGFAASGGADTGATAVATAPEPASAATGPSASGPGGPGPGPGPEPAGREGPSVDLSEPLDALTDEILLCVRYHDALFPGQKVQRVIFVGGEARHVSLCQHVARTLRVPAHVADPMARLSRSGSEPCVGVRFAEAQPGWAVALGLALSPTDL